MENAILMWKTSVWKWKEMNNYFGWFLLFIIQLHDLAMIKYPLKFGVLWERKRYLGWVRGKKYDMHALYVSKWTSCNCRHYSCIHLCMATNRMYSRGHICVVDSCVYLLLFLVLPRYYEGCKSLIHNN